MNTAHSNTPAAEYVAAGNAYSAMLCRAESEWAAEHSRRLEQFDSFAPRDTESAELCYHDPDAVALLVELAIEAIKHPHNCADAEAFKRAAISMVEAARDAYASDF